VGEPRRKKLQQLLEVERAGSEEEIKGAKEGDSRRGESIEANYEASKRNIDEGWNGKG